MTGLVGRIFREFSITIIVSIFASGLVSLTLTPLMCSRLLASAERARRRTGWSASSAASSAASRCCTGARSGSSCGIAGFRRLIWVVCLVGTVYLFYVVPKAFLPVGDSSFIRA